MFDIGWSELLIIAVVAIIVVGPRDLPRMLRTVGQYVGKARRMAGDFRTQFDDALKEADLDDLKKDVDSIRSLNPVTALRKEMGSINEIGKDIKKSVEAPLKGSSSTSADVSTETEPAVSRPAVSRPANQVATKTSAGSSEPAQTSSVQSEPAPKTPKKAAVKKAPKTTAKATQTKRKKATKSTKSESASSS